MRTFLIVIATVVVLSLLAGIYVLMQPPETARPGNIERVIAETTPPSTDLTTGPAQTVIQAGTDVWVKVPNEKTGEIAWQFRTSKYDPQPDNSVNVTDPQAEFFFEDGQMVRIHGTHGRVVVPADLSPGAQARPTSAVPTRGELYNVTISILRTDNPDEPILTCTVNNLAFDNDTFRIATEAYHDAGGKLVPADQVPVQVRGDEYDFDGRGLTIRWNDMDRRLQLLEIAHGESMTIKSRKALSGINGESDDRESPRPSSTTEPRTAPAAREPRQAAVAVEQAEAPSTRPSRQPVYRATFEGGVRIMQGANQLAGADVMNVHVMLDDEPAGAEPAGESAARPARRAETVPATAPRRSTAPAVAATRPAQSEPVVVRWPGRLVVVPLGADAPPLQPGQRNVEMLSIENPVQLRYSGSEVTCASFVYTSDDTLLVNSSERVPLITLKDASDSILYARSLRYSGADGLAVMEGESRAEFRIEQRPDQPADLLTARWTESAAFKLAGASRDELHIQRADIRGDVHIEHSRLNLRSRGLAVDFLEPVDQEKSPRVKQLLASGNVNCDLLDENQRSRHITAERLIVASDSESQEFQPRTLTADGNVRTWDDEQELRAGHLSAILAPTTRPTDSPRLQRVLAQDDVRFKSKDVSGHADRLVATAAGEDQFDVKLSGQPAAVVKTADATLSGPIINIQSGAQRLEVVGSGSLSGALAAEAGKNPTPFEMTWRDRLLLEGASDRGEVSGAVVINSVAEDQSRNSAVSDRLLFTLMPDPKAATRPATRSSEEIVPGFDSLSAKTIRNMTLQGNTEVKSILSAADGSLIRRAHLFAPEIQLHADKRRIIVPSAGRMLYEDRSAPTAPRDDAVMPLGDFTGATAFSWQEKLTYDQDTSRAEMLGSVVIVHQDDKQAADPFRLESARVTADFEPQDKPATKPSATQQAGDSFMPLGSAAKVRMLTADGGTHFTSRQIQFDAESVQYDPTRERLIANGREGVPVHVYDDQGRTTATAQSVWWNTRTQEMGMHDIQVEIRP